MALDDYLCPIEPVNIDIRFSRISTKKESRLTSNSGRFINLSLKNSCLIYLGLEGWEEEVEKETGNSDYHPVILYPDEESSFPEDVFKSSGTPLNIIVLDTSWRNARRWLKKDPFKNLKKIKLKNSHPTGYYLRKPPLEGQLCSLQAVMATLQEIDKNKYSSAQNYLGEHLKHLVKCISRERGMKMQH